MGRMGTDEVVVAEELVEAVGTLRRRLRGRVGRPWAGADLSGAEVDLVRLVRRRPSITVAQAARELGLAANSVSTLVRRLSDAGVLVRLADAADGRVVRLQLTPDAERRVTAWRDDRAAALAAALATLAPADRERLQAALPALRTVSDAL